MQRATPDFVVVTKENFKETAHKLKGVGGIIIICRGDGWTGNLCMELFARATICPNSMTVNSNHGSKVINGEKWQTGWENDRSYSLRQKPKPSGDSILDSARDFFQCLKIGDNLQFFISPQCISSMGCDPEQSLVVYIPKGVSPKNGLSYILEQMTGLFNETKAEKVGFRLTPEHTEQMLSYILKDLDTGEVLKHNAQAGRDADAVVGLG